MYRSLKQTRKFFKKLSFSIQVAGLFMLAFVPEIMCSFFGLITPSLPRKRKENFVGS